MAISMVRKPSETPNINNISDIIPFRYAYGGQNGYVKSKGRELDYTAIGTQFTIGSGRVVLDGVESDIDSDGVIINIDSVSETRYYVVYYNVNLATNTSTIMSQYATGSYPTIDKGDDLTESPEGSANLVLYKFTATSGIISNVEKVVKEVSYLGDRLDKLGFREGVVENLVATASVNRLTRQGNYVLGRLSFEKFNIPDNYLLGNIPQEFAPLFNIITYIPIRGTGYNSSGYQVNYGGAIYATIQKDGQVLINSVVGVYNITYRDTNNYSQTYNLDIGILQSLPDGVRPAGAFYFGYEASPL